MFVCSVCTHTHVSIFKGLEENIPNGNLPLALQRSVGDGEEDVFYVVLYVPSKFFIVTAYAFRI